MVSVAILEMTAAPTPSANRLRRLRAAAAAAAIAACLPYVTLKVAWLTGSSVGSATALGATSLHDGRHTAGNVATLAMELLAVMLALALSHRRGHKLPAAVVLIPCGWAPACWTRSHSACRWGSSPKRSSADARADGQWPARLGLCRRLQRVRRPGGGPPDRVHPLCTREMGRAVASSHAGVGSWPDATATRRRRAAVAVVYAGANLTWAIAGESLAAPPNFDTAAQKSLLVSTGLLALAGASAVRQNRPRTKH